MEKKVIFIPMIGAAIAASTAARAATTAATVATGQVLRNSASISHNSRLEEEKAKAEKAEAEKFTTPPPR